MHSLNQVSTETTRLVSMSQLPPWWLAAILLAIALGVVLGWWGVRRERVAARRALLWTLRALAGVCLAFFVLEPGVRRSQFSPVRARVAVLVDATGSMGFPTEPRGPTRAAAAATKVAALEAAQGSAASFGLDVYAFSSELRATSGAQLARAAPDGRQTDLARALREIGAVDRGGQKLAGVLLMSDGADNVALAQGLTAAAREELTRLGVPVSTAIIGSNGLVDIAINTVRANDFAFVRNALTVEVGVSARGFKGASVPVTLSRYGRVIASSTLTFDADDQQRTVTFSATPDETGRFVYTVSVPVFPDEAIATNNVRTFTVKVIRDRMRVLMVAGRPSWDLRALRGLLQQDPNVELVSFYILREALDQPTPNFQDGELSLIPFPREEIFHDKLHTFDAVIILNFPNDEPQISLVRYAPDLTEYVAGGGALAYLGGDRSFGESPSRETPFDNLLPLVTAGPANTGAITARPTSEGLRHPITALGTGSETAKEAWAALPPIEGMNVTSAKADAVVLLEGGGVPLLAIQEVGRGRTLALATDGSWAWWLPNFATGRSSRVYDRLWANILRWLVRDPDLTPLSVTADPANVELGQPVGVVVVARNQDYSGAAAANIEVQLINGETGAIVETKQTKGGADGTARVEFAAPPAGAYKVVGRASLGDKALGEASDVVAVRATGVETSDTRANPGLLKEIAEASGGAFFATLGFGLADIPQTTPPPLEVGRARDEALWAKWYWLLAAIVVVGLEWTLRRRFGYV